MAKSRSTFEKTQREKAKREKKQDKIAKKKLREKEEQIDIENITPDELMKLHALSEEES